MQAKRLDPRSALAFILGGNALFTIKKPETGGRFTFKVAVPHDTKPEATSIYFVSVLTGENNTSDYRYIGYIREKKFYYGNKSKISFNAPSVQVFEGVFNRMLVHGVFSEKLEFWHEGKCCRCGRTLTVPESIASGIGPECARIKELATA